MTFFKCLVLVAPSWLVEEKDHSVNKFMNKLMKTVFVKHPLALPGSANKEKLANSFFVSSIFVDLTLTKLIQD